MRLRPKTLFARTALTLAVALLLLQLAAFAALAYYVAVPLARRAADDLAALMVLAAQTWAELPPSTRLDLERELLRRHGLVVEPAQTPPPEPSTYLPYRWVLEAALERRVGQDLTVHVSSDPGFYWAYLPVAGRTIRVGFARERIGAQPLYALAMIFTAIAMVVVISALVLARRLTRPLQRLAVAAQAVGRGAVPTSLPETGPEELAQLARRFNLMAREVQDLLANRTTLLAGISHDLRTPLARLRLAIEMLPHEADPALVAGIERDLKAMDALLAQYLALARGMVEEPIDTLDLRELADAVVTDARRAGAKVCWTPGAAPLLCAVRPRALERTLTNLLDNARRYGAGSEIEVECAREANRVVIRVLDRGPGIPEAERETVFRPFHRLEPTHSGANGGSGLGLAIARQLADANCWDITLDARPGGGTIAQVRLPCESPG